MERLPDSKTKKLSTAQTAALMVILTLVGKLLGFIRELILAGEFGTSYIVDSYVMANVIPGTLFAGFFVAIGTAFMPIYSKLVEKSSQQEGNRFANKTITLMAVIALVAAVIGITFAEPLVKLFAKNFGERAIELTTFYLRITFLSLFFSSAIGVIQARLQYKGIFLANILAGYLLDIGIISVIVISALTSYKLLGCGYLVGYLLMFLAISFVSRKAEFSFSLDFKFGNSIREIMILAIPVFVGSYISAINTFVDKSLASGLQEGSVAALNYGNLVAGMVVTLTASVISTLMYPKITKAVSEANWGFFYDTCRACLSVAIIIGIPFGMGAIAFSDEVIQVIYERGAFSMASTDLTAAAFLFYSIGIPFNCINTILVYVNYSVKEMKTTLIASGIAVVVNIVLNLLFVGGLQHKGLALATSIAAVVNMMVLLVLMKRKNHGARIAPEFGKIVKITISSIVAVAIAIATYKLMTILCYIRTVNLVIAVGVAGLVYIAELKLFKIEELNILIGLIPGRKTGTDNNDN